MKFIKIFAVCVIGILLSASMVGIVYKDDIQDHFDNNNDESDNVALGTRSGGTPNLVVSIIYSQYDVEYTDHSSEIIVTIWNKGTEAVNQDIYLKVKKDGETIFNDVATSYLDIEQTYDKHLTWTGRTEKDYFIDALVDPDDTITEIDENDNYLSNIISVLNLHSNTGFENNFHYVGLESEIMRQHNTLVNSADGNLFLSHTDLHVNALQFNLDIIRVYNSQRSHITSPFGNGWTYNHDTHLEFNGNDVKYIDPDASVHYFTWTGSDYTSPYGNYDKLYKDTGPVYKLYKLDGSVMEFASNGDITKITDKNGNSLHYSYSGGQLISVSDESSTPLSYTITYENNRVKTITDPIGRTVTYAYDANGNLKSVTDPRIVDPPASPFKTEYKYDASDRLTNHIDRVDTCMMYSYLTAMGHGKDRIKDVKRALYDGEDPYDEFTMYTYEYYAFRTVVKNAEGFEIPSTIKYNDVGNQIEVEGPEANGNSEKEYYVWEKNRIISYTDARSFTTIYTYDDYGNKLSETDPLGFTAKWEYTVTDDVGNGDYISLMDKYSNKLNKDWTYDYDPKGNLEKITDPTLVVQNFLYNSVGLKIDDSGPPHRTFDYDSHGNLEKITYDDTKFIFYTYNAIGWMLTKTDEDGFLWQYTQYDNNGNLLKEKDPLNYETTYEYDGENRKTKTFNKVGNNKQFVYDPHMCKYDNIVDYEGEIQEYVYDYLGNLREDENKNDKKTYYEYDNFNRLIEERDTYGKKYLWEYDTSGNRIKETNKNEQVSRFSYDAVNRKTDDLDELGHITTTVYNAEGQEVSYINARGFSTSFEYDDVGRLTKTVDALGNQETRSYDTLGRLSMITAKDSTQTAYTYNNRNWIYTITNPVGTTTFTYDGRGNKKTETDPMSRTTTYFYDGLSRMTKVRTPLGFDTTYDYEICSCSGGDSLVDKVIDANGNAIEYEYDKMGRKIKETTQMGRISQYFYDAEGNQIKRIDPNGKTTDYYYDDLNRLILVDYSETEKIHYTYDNEGNIMMSYNEGIGLGEFIYYTYDAKNQLKSVNLYKSGEQGVIFDKKIEYFYDEVGNKILVKDPEGGLTRYQYDGLDRMITIVNSYGEITTFEYDVMNQMKKINYASGMILINNINTKGWLIDQQYMYGMTPLYSIAYTHDTVGKVLTRTDPNGVTTYVYDLDERLTTVIYPWAQTEIFTYDGVGNRLSLQINANPPITYSYNGDNELISISDGTTYTYDNNGNTKTKTKASQTTTYYYDYENRLAWIQFPDATTADYFYDSYLSDRKSGGSCGSNGLQKPDIDVGGRRISKITGGVTTYYFYDEYNLIIEYDSNWVMQVQYTHGPGIDIQISMHQVGQSFYYIKDMLGSIVAITDQSGAIVQTYRYDAWGTFLQQVGGLSNPFTYSGREYDAESGLFYYRARYYNSVIGRFMQRDPLGLVEGTNVYVYVENEPVNKIDPSGTKSRNHCRRMTHMALHVASKSDKLMSHAEHWASHAFIGCVLHRANCNYKQTLDMAWYAEWLYPPVNIDLDEKDVSATMWGWYYFKKDSHTKCRGWWNKRCDWVGKTCAEIALWLFPVGHCAAYWNAEKGISEMKCDDKPYAAVPTSYIP